VDNTLLAVLTLGLLAIAIFAQELPALKAQAQTGGVQASSFVDRFRNIFPGTGIFLVGGTIWTFWKWVFIPGVFVGLWLVGAVLTTKLNVKLTWAVILGAIFYLAYFV